jgi:hypothetical protein
MKNLSQINLRRANGMSIADCLFCPDVHFARPTAKAARMALTGHCNVKHSGMLEPVSNGKGEMGMARIKPVPRKGKGKRLPVQTLEHRMNEERQQTIRARLKPVASPAPAVDPMFVNMIDTMSDEQMLTIAELMANIARDRTQLKRVIKGI